MTKVMITDMKESMRVENATPTEAVKEKGRALSPFIARRDVWLAIAAARAALWGLRRLRARAEAAFFHRYPLALAAGPAIHVLLLTIAALEEALVVLEACT
jgi:hypothetical protein